jgi:hypothetical protein
VAQAGSGGAVATHSGPCPSPVAMPAVARNPSRGLVSNPSANEPGRSSWGSVSFAVGERAERLVARERLAAARKIAVLRVPRTCLHEQPLLSSFVINNS